MRSMMMNTLRCMISTVALTLIALAHSQDQSGFISIDCGLPDASDYIDSTTGIRYTSDTQFTTTGTNSRINPVYQTSRLQNQLATVRAFPQGIRNCYTLTPPNGEGMDYIIRASFMYGNYDSRGKPPTFDLLLGVDAWDTIKLDNSTQVVTVELIHRPSSGNLDVCLVNIGKGIPLISTLQVRHVTGIYKPQFGSLALAERLYVAASDQIIRYDDDIYDRIWEPTNVKDEYKITTLFTVETNSHKLPSAAMKSAILPFADNKNLTIRWNTLNSSTRYHVLLHFAELEKLSANETREFNVTFNGRPYYKLFSPRFLSAFTIFSDDPLSGTALVFKLIPTERSTHPPIINAVELYSVRELSQRSTNQLDVDAMMKIKSAYNVTKNWQGDPCSPVAYSWDGVNCNFESNAPTIIHLNLSSSLTTGGIATSISNLKSLQVLDLSDNNLTGEIPDFLADLEFLTTLYLVGNKFTGSVPPALLEKSSKGLLTLSLDENPDLCTNGSCSNKKSTKLIVLIVAPIAALLVLAAIVILTVCLIKKAKWSGGTVQHEHETQPAVHTQRRGGLSGFSHSQVLKMTKGFEKELGRGGFATVYYGRLNDGTEVAAKVPQQTIQGSEQFQTEVELLKAVRHKNLVSLIGYCDEENKLALIYEYMANGDLKDLILKADRLNWKQRLQIAIDTAQGLDYLHHGCRPPIVHRDVKTANILLNENLQAKVADFGMSKIFPNEYISYMTTRVIGTPVYLDPEYNITQQLNEKSDVYSFGVILLELITGKPAVIKANAVQTSLIQWVRSTVESGDIWSIVDHRLHDVGNQLSVWKIIDISMECLKPTSNERPTMNQTVTELKDCLAMEMDTQGNSDISVGPFISPYESMAPRAR